MGDVLMIGLFFGGKKIWHVQSRRCIRVVNGFLKENMTGF